MQYFNWNSDPIELRVLKQQLANLKCKCLNCKKYNKQFKKNIQNAEVQANQRHGSVDRFSQATDQKIEKPIKVDKANSNRLINNGDEICPSCRIIAQFLNGNVHKVLKDEESETYAISCCDKSTNKSVEYLEKSTSTTMKCKSSCDMLKTFSNEFDDSTDNKKRNHERVSFEDAKKKVVDTEKEMSGHSEHEISIFGGGLAKSKSMCGHCICLETFINAIRPPKHFLMIM